MVDTTKRNKANQRAVVEKLIECVEKSEEWLDERTKWDTRGMYITMIIGSVTVGLLIGAAIAGHYFNSMGIAWLIGIAMAVQIWLVIWWAFFLRESKREERKAKDWWNKNIKPLKDRDATVLLR